jgi:hypothetical protein
LEVDVNDSLDQGAEPMRPGTSIAMIVALIMVACSPKSNLSESTYDDFSASQLDREIWAPETGDWTLEAGHLRGHWPESRANCDNGIFFLHKSIQPDGDFALEVDIVVSPGGRSHNGHKIVLRQSYQNLYLLAFYSSIGRNRLRWCHAGEKGGDIDETYTEHMRTDPGAINHVKLVKSENTYSVYLNDQHLYDFENTRFHNGVRLGLGTYGTSLFDNVRLLTPE